MPRDQSVITTYHEAGHAVMALAGGFMVTEITNVPDDQGLGYVSWLEPSPHTTESRIKSVLVSAAGLAADYVHAARNGGGENEVFLGHFDDQRRASSHLAELGDDGQFLVYVQIAAEFFRRPDVWAWVEAFADLLTKAGTINGLDLLCRASQNVPKLGDDDLEFLKIAVDASKRGELRK